MSTPVQATNSCCNTPSGEQAQSTPLQFTGMCACLVFVQEGWYDLGSDSAPLLTHIAPSAEDRRGSSSSATSQSQYDIHPQHGAIPPPLTAEMQQRVHTLRQPSPPKDVDPKHGLLPPHPPTSSAGLTTPHPETGGAHHDIFEPGMQTVHHPTSNGLQSPQGNSAAAGERGSASYSWYNYGKTRIEFRGITYPWLVTEASFQDTNEQVHTPEVLQWVCNSIAADGMDRR